MRQISLNIKVVIINSMLIKNILIYKVAKMKLIIIYKFQVKVQTLKECSTSQSSSIKEKKKSSSSKTLAF